MNLPILISWTSWSHCQFNGCWVEFFIFIQIWIEYSVSKQCCSPVRNIVDPDQMSQIVAALFAVKRMLGLYGLRDNFHNSFSNVFSMYSLCFRCFVNVFMFFYLFFMFSLCFCLQCHIKKTQTEVWSIHLSTAPKIITSTVLMVC